MYTPWSSEPLTTHLPSGSVVENTAKVQYLSFLCPASKVARRPQCGLWTRLAICRRMDARTVGHGASADTQQATQQGFAP